MVRRSRLAHELVYYDRALDNYQARNYYLMRYVFMCLLLLIIYKLV